MHLQSAASKGKSHWHVLTDPRSVLVYGGVYAFKEQRPSKKDRAAMKNRAANRSRVYMSPAEWLGPDPDSCEQS